MNYSLECVKDNIVKAIYLIIAIFILHSFLVNVNDDTLIETEINVVIENHNTFTNENIDDDANDELKGMQTRKILL